MTGLSRLVRTQNLCVDVSHPMWVSGNQGLFRTRASASAGTRDCPPPAKGMANRQVVRAR